MFREFAEQGQKTRNDLEFRRKRREMEGKIAEQMAETAKLEELDMRRVRVVLTPVSC